MRLYRVFVAQGTAFADVSPARALDTPYQVRENCALELTESPLCFDLKLINYNEGLNTLIRREPTPAHPDSDLRKRAVQAAEYLKSYSADGYQEVPKCGFLIEELIHEIDRLVKLSKVI